MNQSGIDGFGVVFTRLGGYGAFPVAKQVGGKGLVSSLGQFWDQVISIMVGSAKAI